MRTFSVHNYILLVTYLQHTNFYTRITLQMHTLHCLWLMVDHIEYFPEQLLQKVPVPVQTLTSHAIKRVSDLFIYHNVNKINYHNFNIQ